MTHRYLSKQQGLTLLELMISMALGLFLIAGALSVFISSKQSYQTNQRLSSIQDSGRFALNILTQDIRNTGYKSICLTNPVNHTGNDITGSIWSHQDTAIKGWENSKPSFLTQAITSNTDSLFIQFAGSGSLFPGDTSNLLSSNSIKFGNGNFTPVDNASVLISDGLGCDLFKVASVDNTSITKADNTAWSHDYTDRFELLSMYRILYYIADNNGKPTLFKALFKDDLTLISAEALIPNVNALNFSYGIADDNDITNYVTANNVTDWNKVVAVRVSFNALDDHGNSKEFESIISLRNRLL